MIFSVDKFKAYQNVSLHLFDQESLIILPEDEGKKNSINGEIPASLLRKTTQFSDVVVRPSMHTSAGKLQSGAAEFNWEALRSAAFKGD